MDYTKYSIDELVQLLDSLAFIQESIIFTTAETGIDTKGNDFLWSGLILKENIKAVSAVIKERSSC